MPISLQCDIADNAS